MTHVHSSKIGAAALAVASMLAVSPASFADAPQGALKTIAETKTITIGHRESSKPFSFVNEKGEVSGYAIELCNRIAADIKAALKDPAIVTKYAPVNPQNRIAKVVDGSVDMECGSTTNTLSRQEQVDFSAIYFTTGTRLLARKSSGAKEVEDFNGKAIAVIPGSTNEKAIKALADAGPLSKARLVAVKDYDEGLAALENSGADTFATDDIVLFGLLAKSKMKGELDVIGRFLTYDPYGIMIRRDDSAFRLAVNKTLADLYRSKEIEKIYAKWFDPMGVPISPLLKAGFELQALPQ